MRTDTARAVHTPLRTPDVGGVESWEAQVHCRGPLAWMWDDSLDGEFESPSARKRRHRKAAEVCSTCPARSACALAATQTPRAEGIWAGTLIGGSRPLMVPGRPCLRCERPLLPGKLLPWGSAMSDDPKLSLCEYRGSTVVIIKHRDRDVQVAFSPKGKSIQVWVDGEKVEPFLDGINGVVKR